ncbi:hypothetical protein Hypma_006134 [Hypsizygus marmoreus]|uniref:N-acetyltransferase domain-containing protein n=1 Tax=Hypsizygus marmoreus TaxID=39966 RepID=A0A369K591_HYPMA|nr:hypothetical protein Hypma_006134 [Hypsizygus marmoreus]
MSLQLDACTATISVTPDDENPKSLHNIELEVTHPELGHIGRLSGIKILRQFCGTRFLEVLDEHSQELQTFGSDIFDKNGRIRPWLVEEGRRKGTGCWGRELDTGILIYILNMSVDEKYRNKGIGSWMVKKLVESPHVQKDDTLVCWPSPTDVEDKAAWTALQDKQISFFRKNGFRRIGRTNFFGYSPDPSHPSRQLAADADVDAQGKGFDMEDLSVDELMARYPLHFEVVNILGPDVSNIIQAAYTQDPASIHRPDASGFTPIYMALSRGNIPAVRKLLQLGVNDDLANSDNKEGLTPLEALESSMRSGREFSETLLGQWGGYSDDELRCEFLTKRAMGLPLVSNDEAEYVKKRKWGCTCGVCAGGWLSKRMRFRLEGEAGISKDNMEMEMDYFTRGEAIDDPIMLSYSSHIPPHLHRSIYKTFYKGYQSIFEAISAFLRTSDAPLSVASIASTAFGPGIDFYLGRGGKYEYALDAVTHAAEEQSELGDGTFEEMYEDETEVGTEYTGLPKCANDLEFGMVRRMVGLDPQLRWGPYYGEEDDDDDINMDDDEDDDDDNMIGVLSAGAVPEFLQELLRRMPQGLMSPGPAF